LDISRRIGADLFDVDHRDLLEAKVNGKFVKIPSPRGAAGCTELIGAGPVSGKFLRPTRIPTRESQPQPAREDCKTWSWISEIVVKLPVHAQFSIDDLKNLNGDRPRIVVVQAMDQRSKGLDVRSQPGQEKYRSTVWDGKVTIGSEQVGISVAQLR
jgi:hypothetical protein